MAATFDIGFEPSRGLVRFVLAGFFAADDMAAFASRCRDVYAGLPTGTGRHVTLIDITACKIQSQEVIEGFRALLRAPAMQSRRLAFVLGDSPARMQIRRLIERDSARAFDDVAAAEAWLHDGATAAHAA